MSFGGLERAIKVHSLNSEQLFQFNWKLVQSSMNELYILSSGYISEIPFAIELKPTKT